MKAVFILFDTLNLGSIGPYNQDGGKTPNFDRLAKNSLTFDNHYVGSLPCMPARRELLTGRYNFLHRSWGPLEPFDNAFPEILSKECSVYSHLVSDHSHYWEDGGATYHTRYDSVEMIRGQEKDAWKGIVDPLPEWEQKYHPSQYAIALRHKLRRNIVNREFYKDYEQYPAVQTFDSGLEFLSLNHKADNWFLQIETFDPHEPFQVPDNFRKDFPTEYRGPTLDWPRYGAVEETPEEIAELRANYRATIAHCDYQLGRVLDFFDEHNLWKDTLLVVTTDHGFLLGERDLWGKNMMPVYNEIAHIPLFISHPEHLNKSGGRRSSLTQTIDLMPFFLDYFGASIPSEVQGKSLIDVIESDKPVRQAGIYGLHGAAINVTDGRYTYFRYPKDIHGGNLNQYTLMPTHIQGFFSIDELKDATLSEPFNFTKGVKVMKTPSTPLSPVYNRQGAGVQIDVQTRLYDLVSDPLQQTRITDNEVEKKMESFIIELMKESDAPKELYYRFDLSDD
ncbi:sulfatase [Leclercia adecarboxylata]|uniref:sulfatase n=1 Tax=Leclercia adecarboxylata TaxID=83655 RepID=UPI00202A4CBB|nr:sulfatase [Leclercia adecarboxylata]URN97435.1 sulfatase [Leclercia adecarboxylata]